MVTYLENIKKSPDKFLELTNGKVAGKKSKYKLYFFILAMNN